MARLRSRYFFARFSTVTIMNIKVLVVNLMNPSNSKYIDMDKFTSEMWGRRMSQTMLVLVSDTVRRVVDIKIGDVVELEKYVTSQMEEMCQN